MRSCSDTDIDSFCMLSEIENQSDNLFHPPIFSFILRFKFMVFLVLRFV